jgi:hypothetical protein
MSVPPLDKPCCKNGPGSWNAAQYIIWGCQRRGDSKGQLQRLSGAA